MKKAQEYIILAVLLLIVFAMYLRTAFPVFKNNDSPETIAASVTLGIQHPPGYPIFTMAAKAASLIPLANQGFKLNVFSSFLALLCLLLVYLLVKRVDDMAGMYEKFSPYAGVVIAAVTFYFWNQAIEAKGGIYMLNALFYMFILYLIVLSMEGFRKKYLYMIAFIYGLGMSNHWPSMITILPVLIFLFVVAIKCINLKTAAFAVAFLILGLSPYFYLFIRAAGNPVMNQGDPRTWNDFWWLVLRKGYISPVLSDNLSLSLLSFKAFIRMFHENLPYVWLFGLAGMIVMFFRRRKIFLLLASLYVCIMGAVLFYNPRNYSFIKEAVDWFMGLLTLPAALTFSIFTTYGVCAATTAIDNKWIKYSEKILIIAILVFTGLGTFISLNNSRDYLAYDYGKNILRTIDRDGYYLGVGDSRVLPIYYIQNVEHYRQDVNMIPATYLSFQWAIDEFAAKYGELPMRQFYPGANLALIINKIAPEQPVYGGYNEVIAKKLETSLKHGRKGMLLNPGKEEVVYGPGIFSLYSYRGIFTVNEIIDPEDKLLIGWYPYSMVEAGSMFLKADDPVKALQLFNKALLFPVRVQSSALYNKMSLAYGMLNETSRAMHYMQKAVKLRAMKQ